MQDPDHYKVTLRCVQLMASSIYNDKKLEAYLRNELPEAEVLALEDELLRDDELFQRLQTVEMNLLDGYLENQMTGEERQRFETTFLSNPANRLKLDEERVFRESLEILRKRRSRFPQLAIAAGILIVLAVLFAWYSRRPENRSQGNLITQASPPPTPQSSVTPTPPGPSPSASPSVSPTPPDTTEPIKEQWLYLKEDRTGVMGPSDVVPILVLPETDTLLLHFELLEDAATRASFRVSVKDEFDRPIFPPPGTIDVKPGEIRHRGSLRKALSVQIPLSSLKEGARYRFEIPELNAHKNFIVNRMRSRS